MHAQFTNPTQLDPRELRWVGLKNPSNWTHAKFQTPNSQTSLMLRQMTILKRYLCVLHANIICDLLEFRYKKKLIDTAYLALAEFMFSRTNLNQQASSYQVVIKKLLNFASKLNYQMAYIHVSSSSLLFLLFFLGWCDGELNLTGPQYAKLIILISQASLKHKKLKLKYSIKGETIKSVHLVLSIG